MNLWTHEELLCTVTRFDNREHRFNSIQNMRITNIKHFSNIFHFEWIRKKEMKYLLFFFRFVYRSGYSLVHYLQECAAFSCPVTNLYLLLTLDCIRINSIFLLSISKYNFLFIVCNYFIIILYYFYNLSNAFRHIHNSSLKFLYLSPHLRSTFYLKI